MRDDYFPTLFTIILSLSDAFWYGWCYEIKGWFKGWLFKEYPMFGEIWVPYYRAYQWSLDIIAVYLVYTTNGFWSTILMLLAWYFGFKEYAYYLILNQIDILKELEKQKIIPYWLNRIYFATWIFFIDGFTVKKFTICFIIGCLFLLASSII